MSDKGHSNIRGTRINANDYSSEDKFFGRMTDPTGGAFVRGLCGDTMEFYLVIQDNIITDVKCYTDGCSATKACGRAVAKRVIGRNILDALETNPKEIIDTEKDLPEENRHCAILAVSAMYRAIADYLLKP